MSKESKKTCSFHCKSKNGRNISGTAAFLHLASENGGIDSLLHKIAINAYEQGIKEGVNKVTHLIKLNLKGEKE